MQVAGDCIVAPRFHFHHATVRIVGTRINNYSNLTGGDRSKRELSPDLVVASHTPASYGGPGRTIPVLHIKGCDPVKTKRLRQRRLDRMLWIILLRDYIDLADRLAAVEVDFNPVRKTV